MTEPRNPETEGVISGEPLADDLGTVIVAEETGERLGEEYFAAEGEPTPDLDDERDYAVLEAADQLTADGREPTPGDLA
jgi:hypothetical protein